jgi:hypothetical protein
VFRVRTNLSVLSCRGHDHELCQQKQHNRGYSDSIQTRRQFWIPLRREGFESEYKRSRESSPRFSDRYHRRFRRPNWMRFGIWAQVFSKWFLNSRDRPFLLIHMPACYTIHNVFRGGGADHRARFSFRGGASVLFLVMPPDGKDSHTIDCSAALPNRTI